MKESNLAKTPEEKLQEAIDLVQMQKSLLDEKGEFIDILTKRCAIKEKHIQDLSNLVEVQHELLGM